MDVAVQKCDARGALIGRFGAVVAVLKLKISISEIRELPDLVWVQRFYDNVRYIHFCRKVRIANFGI